MKSLLFAVLMNIQALFFVRTIGVVPDVPHDERVERQPADFLYRDDKTGPLQKSFGRFTRLLLVDRARFHRRESAQFAGLQQVAEFVESPR